MSSHTAPYKDGMAIILHSGSYDRVSYALSMAVAALAMDMEVHILLTHDGLKRFIRGHLEDLGDETPPSVRARLERGLGADALSSLESQLAEAKKLGLKLYACSNDIASLQIGRQDLMDEVDEVIGLVTFLKLARAASMHWYI